MEEPTTLRRCGRRTDCGESDPVVLEFDHLEPDAKCFNIGQSLPYRSWQTIHEEIAE